METKTNLHMQDLVRNKYHLQHGLWQSFILFLIERSLWVYGPKRQISFLLIMVLFGAIAGYLIFQPFLETSNSRIGVFLFLCTTGTLCWAVLYALKINLIRFHYLARRASGSNNDAKSIHYTLDIINRAKKWVILHDYGENSPTNIYNNQEVGNALLDKLNTKEKSFEVSIVFQKDQEDIEELGLVKTLRKWQDENSEKRQMVNISSNIDREHEQYKQLNADPAQTPHHYKINEQGYAYLTTHKPGTQKRNFVYYTPWAGKHVANILECLKFHNTTQVNKKNKKNNDNMNKQPVS